MKILTIILEMDHYRSIRSPISPQSFWQSVNVLVTKFNVINKRLWSSKILCRYFCKPKSRNWIAPLKPIEAKYNDDILSYLQTLFTHWEIAFVEGEYDSDIEILVVELLPKKFTYDRALQIVCLDKKNAIATFYNITPENPERNVSTLCPNFTYSLSLEKDMVSLRIDSDSSSPSQTWLLETVLPQFVKWGRDQIDQKGPFCKESLQLISSDKYYRKYNELKYKFGKEMVEKWPETTDPSKYVYEDIAIATYLLLLWEDDAEKPKKKTFVDLGCGNGLLVYILTQEGHSGIGIDVRKRKIWDTYPKNINLEEKTIIPSDSNLFPHADWLIGNHSDELTPWIPVIATKSSYKCNFFLLPCCAYNFDGTKYQRKDSSKSQYMEYIQYIKTISETCGFEANIDRLKIPSTKRICLVGCNKIYSETEHPEVCVRIHNFITKDSSLVQANPKSWVSDFQPRKSVEKVRNCTQIDRTVIDNVINCVSNYLIEECNSETKWSVGKEVNINELVTLIPEENLKAMKAECGGLQTLLKNNHHIFKVTNGKVQLRYPRTINEVFKNNGKTDKSKTKVQLKPCWFYRNHPKGCPLTDDTCSYLHIKDGDLIKQIL